VLRRVLILSALGLIAALLFGAGAAARIPDLTAPKAFKAFPVYWPGPNVKGLPLESLNGDTRPGHLKDNGFTFSYGSCELAGTDHPSYASPLQIQVSSTCSRWAGALHKKGSELFDYRGAKAYWFPGLPTKEGLAEPGPLEIFTGRTTVVIFVGLSSSGTKDAKELAFAAARQLRTFAQSKPPAKLPAPAPGSLWGKLPCQTKPG
jgi:hypothetical protein